MKNGNKDFGARGGPGYESPLRVANYIPSPKENPGAVVFWDAGADFYGTLSIVEAQELIEVLQAIIADYPKEPTNEEILNELPVGSVVSNTGGTYVKAGNNWFGAETGMNWTANNNYDWANDYGPLVVKYRGDE